LLLYLCCNTSLNSCKISTSNIVELYHPVLLVWVGWGNWQRRNFLFPPLITLSDEHYGNVLNNGVFPATGRTHQPGFPGEG
jgi:hypothetical protein